MKKIIISIFLLFIGFNLSAQTYSIKVGTTLSNLWGQDLNSTDWGDYSTILNPGILIGGSITFGGINYEKYDFISHPIGETTIELLYSENGWGVIDATSPYLTGQTKHQNLQLNGMTYFPLSENFSLGAGIYTAFMLGYDHINAGKIVGGLLVVNDVNVYAKNRFDVGPNVSTKIRLNDNLALDIRYSLGLLKHFYQEPVPGVSVGRWYELYNGSIQTSVSYYFGKIKYKDSWRE